VTAINYLENNEANKIEEIYFLALTDHQRDACLNAFKAAETDPVSKDSPQWLETRPSFKSE